MRRPINVWRLRRAFFLRNGRILWRVEQQRLCLPEIRLRLRDVALRLFYRDGFNRRKRLADGAQIPAGVILVAVQKQPRVMHHAQRPAVCFQRVPIQALRVIGRAEAHQRHNLVIMIVNLTEQRNRLLIRARGVDIAALTQKRVADPHERGTLSANIFKLTIHLQRLLKHLHRGLNVRRAAAHGLAKQRFPDIERDRGRAEALRRQKGLGLPQSVQRIGELRFQPVGDAGMQQNISAKRGGGGFIKLPQCVAQFNEGGVRLAAAQMRFGKVEAQRGGAFPVGLPFLKTQQAAQRVKLTVSVVEFAVQV